LQDANFADVLLIRQALGRGILKEMTSNQEFLKEGLVETLGMLLLDLFPDGKDVKKKLQKLVEDTVEVANMMTEEKALFISEMVYPATKFNPETMEAFDGVEGRVKLCMFPVFGIWIRNIEDKNDTIVLVKANVELGA
jgi:hypothetical protein